MLARLGEVDEAFELVQGRWVVVKADAASSCEVGSSRREMRALIPAGMRHDFAQGGEIMARRQLKHSPLTDYLCALPDDTSQREMSFVDLEGRLRLPRP